MKNDKQMPSYTCNKVVSALKIWAIAVKREEGSVIIHPMEEGFFPFTPPESWLERYKGSRDDLGYFIAYEDGYTSWSPTKAFEEGYKLITK